MDINEYRNKDLIFTDRNGRTLEVYEYDRNTNNVTAVVDNNYNSYNSKNSAYEYGVNN